MKDNEFFKIALDYNVLVFTLIRLQEKAQSRLSKYECSSTFFATKTKLEKANILRTIEQLLIVDAKMSELIQI